MQDNWTDQLRETLSEYEVTPPAGLWESLNEALPALTASSPETPVAESVRRSFLSRLFPNRRSVLALAASIALILSIGISVWYLTGKDTLTLQTATQGSYTDISAPTLTGATSTLPSSKPPRSTSLLTTAVKKQSIEPDTEECAKPINSEDSPVNTTPPVNPDKSATQDTTVSSDIEKQSYILRHNSDGRKGISGSYNHLSRTSHHTSTTSENRFSVGLLTAYAGNNTTTSDSRDIGSNTPPDINGSQPPSSIEETTETRYHLPLRVGLTLQYPLTDRLSVEAGLMYTYLSSEERKSLFDQVSVSSYHLHYLGIPLSLKYRLASWKAVDLYLSAGGAVEKCISGKRLTTFITPDSQSKVRESCPEYPWQWSLTAGCGLQFRPLNFIGIYIEPTLVYYPCANTSLPIIYRDHPVTFNLTLGLRLLLP